MKHNKTTTSANLAIICQHCGCQVSEPGWRNCPRCQQDLNRCGGCVACGNCKRS